MMRIKARMTTVSALLFCFFTPWATAFVLGPQRPSPMLFVDPSEDTTRFDQRQRRRTLALSESSSAKEEEEQITNSNSEKDITGAEHSLVQTILPALKAYQEQYGHPNVPLGTSEGRTCETLRRLHIQRKLPESDVQILTDLGFRWHSLEDVYHTTDFDEMLQRLQDYKEANDGDVSPPKKYDQDPELGAWTVGLRRIGADNLPAEQVHALESLGFLWVSRRQCGSSFMKQYRILQEQIAADSNQSWRDDPTNQKWVKAIQAAHAKQSLSATRVHYMEQLLGEDWESIEF